MYKGEIPVIKRVSVSRINYLKPQISVNFNSYENLKRSIEKVGVIEPIVIMEAGGIYEIIDGTLRVRALVECGYEDVISIILENLSFKEALTLHLFLNFQRFSKGEIMELSGRMKDAGMKEEEIAFTLNSIYGTHTSPESVRDLIELRSAFPGVPLMIHRKEVTVTSLKIIKNLPPEWRDVLIELIKGRTSGEQISFLRMVEDGIISGKLSGPDELKNNSFEMGKEFVMKKVYPSIYRREKELKERIKSLPVPLSLRLPDYLEGENVKISLEVNIHDNEEKIGEIVKELIKEVRKKLIYEV